MTELLSKTYYGNTLESWLTAFGLILLSIIIGKLLFWFFSKIVRLFTAKTKTQLDDIIVDMVEEPIIFLMVISSIWFILKTLVLPKTFISLLGNVYQVVIAMLIAWMISRLFDALYKEYLVAMVEKSDSDLDDQILPILKKGVKTIIWALAIIIGLNNAGYDVAALIAGLGIGGLALAMAAKDTVANIFGGFTIFTDKPFRINDRIKVAGYDGTVKEVGVRSTRITTLEGRVVTIPNATFADAPVENISWEPTRKIKLDLGLTYDTAVEKMQQAMDILKQINEENEKTEAKMTIAFNGFGDFAMNILFVYYIKKGADIGQVQTAINLNILKQFNEAGLEFAFPTQTLYNVNAG